MIGLSIIHTAASLRSYSRHRWEAAGRPWAAPRRRRSTARCRRWTAAGECTARRWRTPATRQAATGRTRRRPTAGPDTSHPGRCRNLHPWHCCVRWYLLSKCCSWSAVGQRIRCVNHTITYTFAFVIVVQMCSRKGPFAAPLTVDDCSPQQLVRPTVLTLTANERHQKFNVVSRPGSVNAILYSNM